MNEAPEVRAPQMQTCCVIEGGERCTLRATATTVDKKLMRRQRLSTDPTVSVYVHRKKAKRSS